MARICIVDDDFDYCEELEYALRRDGHEVITSFSGFEAIERGSLFRPDVLVTDWMLKGAVHGLSVSDALQVVNPHMRSILMTGFASADLQQDAGSAGIIEFIEKPFHLGTIRKAVSAALEGSTQSQIDAAPIGVFEIDSEGVCVFANDEAVALFGITRPDGNGAYGLELSEPSVLEHSIFSWTTIPGPTPSSAPVSLIGRTFQDVDSRLYLAVSSLHPTMQHDERIYLLLGERPPTKLSLPLDGHVLVVDDHSEVRRVSARVLRVCSCFCHTAKTHGEALRLLERDSAIRYVILDYDMPGTDAGQFIDELRKRRAGVRIIGTSAVDAREKFGPLGVKNYLAKPWNVEDLVRCCAQAL